MVSEPGLCVLTVNVTLVAPAGIVTFDGTVATDVLLLDSTTTTPPEGAGALSVTVPVEELPPLTLVRFRVSEANDTPELDVAVGVDDDLGVAVGVLVAVSVFVGVLEAFGVAVGVADDLGVTVADGIEVAVAVAPLG